MARRLMLLMVLSIVIDTFNNEMSIITPILLILNVGYSGYIAYRLRKKRLDTSDCATPEEYDAKKAKYFAMYSPEFISAMEEFCAQHNIPIVGKESKKNAL